MNNLTMPPRLRKWTLTAHITFSVGWAGAVAGFLALSIAGVTSQDPEVVRAAYVGMNLIGWFIIVPCSLAALLSGIVQSLGTEWGLFRHYWLLLKFVFTIVATLLLLLHQFAAVAGAARRFLGLRREHYPMSGGLESSLWAMPASGCWCYSWLRHCRS